MAHRHSVKVSNIDWDTDGEEVDLPKEMEFVVETDGEVDYGSDAFAPELDVAIASHMSDTVGWCVNSFALDSCEPASPAPAP